MKKLLFIMITLVTIVNTSISQNKKDNTILVHGFVSYDQVKGSLFDYGYTATTTDTSFITTSRKNVGGIAEVNYIIKRSDTAVILKGFLSGTFNGTSVSFPLDNTPGNHRRGFETMDKIAKSFGHLVTYLKSN